MTETICPFCEVGVMDEVTYKRNLGFDDIIALKKMVCTNCGSESVPEELIDWNLKQFTPEGK